MTDPSSEGVNPPCAPFCTTSHQSGEFWRGYGMACTHNLLAGPDSPLRVSAYQGTFDEPGSDPVRPQADPAVVTVETHAGDGECVELTPFQARIAAAALIAAADMCEAPPGEISATSTLDLMAAANWAAILKRCEYALTDQHGSAFPADDPERIAFGIDPGVYEYSTAAVLPDDLCALMTLIRAVLDEATRAPEEAPA